MLTELHLKNFRGFKDLTVAPLKPINLIIGQNNTGKTALLESLAFLLGQPPGTGNFAGLFRTPTGDWNENFWKWLFHNKDIESKVEIKAAFDNQEEFSIHLLKSNPQIPDYDGEHRRFDELTQAGKFPVFVPRDRKHAGLKLGVLSSHPTYPNPRQDALDYNRIVLQRKRKDVVALLKQIEPRLESIDALNIQTDANNSTEPFLYADVGLEEMIPVSQLGQGFNRLLSVFSQIITSRANVLLIDEIENGLHHSVLRTVWAGLFNAARDLNLQIFATTHSWECVLAADKSASEQPKYELNLIRLDRIGPNVKATIVDKQALEVAKSHDWEMR